MQDLAKDILKRCKDAAKDFVKEEAEAFLADAKEASESMAGDLAKWSAAYKAGKIDEAGLQRLIKRRKTTLQTQALEQAGIAEIRLEQLRNQMVDIVVGSISAAV
ncbi:MAG: hypothetical protein JXR40_06055 [Pontiellaceae bacterium]|nr:hypothetical protein [Pontiellaceae bacterium]